MNVHKFASLISYVTMIANRCGTQCLARDDIEEIGKLVSNLMPEPLPAPQSFLSPVEVESFMKFMKEKTNRIDAIRSCRMLTGLGLKEAKDLVERYW